MVEPDCVVSLQSKPWQALLVQQASSCCFTPHVTTGSNPKSHHTTENCTRELCRTRRARLSRKQERGVSQNETVMHCGAAATKNTRQTSISSSPTTMPDAQTLVAEVSIKHESQVSQGEQYGTKSLGPVLSVALSSSGRTTCLWAKCNTLSREHVRCRVLFLPLSRLEKAVR